MRFTVILGLVYAGVALAECCFAECDCVKTPRGRLCQKCFDGTKMSPCCGKGCDPYCCKCDGCRGNGTCKKGLTLPTDAPSNQIPIESDTRTGDYSKLFAPVYTGNAQAMSLAEYLVWVHHNDPSTFLDATATNIWIEYFHSFDANGDGKLQPNEMDRPAVKTTEEL